MLTFFTEFSAKSISVVPYWYYNQILDVIFFGEFLSRTEFFCHLITQKVFRVEGWNFEATIHVFLWDSWQNFMNLWPIINILEELEDNSASRTENKLPIFDRSHIINGLGYILIYFSLLKLEVYINNFYKHFGHPCKHVFLTQHWLSSIFTR